MKITKFFFLSFYFSLLAASHLSAQQEDPVLFTVNEDPVRVSEFRYIYEKNNTENADYSEESLNEYFEIYKNFKLKIALAREMGLDTLPRMRQELAGYRKQLASSYMIDKQTEEELVKEAFDRIQYDVEIAHILVRSPEGANKKTGRDRSAAIAGEAFQELESGKSWEEVAAAFSGDQNSSEQGGYLGWFTALFPNGFHEMEAAAYTTKVGEHSAPVKSPLGWHIIKVLDKRPARGKVLGAQIFLSNKKHGKTQAAALADSVYSLLQSGSSYEDLVTQFSDDNKTKNKGGVLGYIGIRQYSQSFEDALFGLTSDGQYTKPVESSIGYHILKRVGRQEVDNYDAMSRNLRPSIRQNSRSQEAKSRMIQKVKKESQFSRNVDLLSRYRSQLDEDFFVYNWSPPMSGDSTVYTLVERPKSKGQEKLEFFKHSLDDLNDYLSSDVRTRLQGRGQKSAGDVFDQMIASYEDKIINQYQERNLEAAYPEFKALMREYEEGIILFEISKEKVWDKAAQDSLGLKNFFYKNRDNYTWDRRVRVHEYQIKTDNPKLAKKIHKKTQKWDHSKTVLKMDKLGEDFDWTLRIIDLKELPTEMTKVDGAQTKVMQDDKGGHYWYKIDELLPATFKSFEDSRGFAMADYQRYLEEQWVQDLQKKYVVEKNEKVFQSLIKK